MALTLDATLATAQNSQSRRPLVEIVSSQNIADIPFDGAALTSETFSEFSPNVLAHSTGRLALAYCYGPDADGDCGIKYVYTDTGRAEYTPVTIELFDSTSYVMKGVSICELTDTTIGLSYLYTVSSKYYLASRIITVEGVDVAGSVKAIGNWATSVFTSEPWIKTVAANSYLMLYAKQSGANYYIYKRTSADFLTWSAESALTIGGLTSTWKLNSPSMMIEYSTGDYWLWFDALEASSPGGDPLTNIYYAISTDDGATWANAVKFTSYTSYSAIGNHPLSLQKTTNAMHVLYTQVVGALHMEDDETGWPTGDNSSQLSWDSVNRKLYIINTGRYGALTNIVKIDVDTWSVDTYWDYTTTPALPTYRAVGITHACCNATHSGHHIAFSYEHTDYTYPNRIFYLNGETNTATTYIFRGPGANTTGGPADQNAWRFYARYSYVDIENNKIWAIFCPYTGVQGYSIGYIDLTETGPSYTFTTVVSSTSVSLLGITGYEGGLHIDPDNGYIIITSGRTAIDGLGWHYDWGSMAVHDYTTGALIKQWDFDTITCHGVRKCLSYGGKIYASTYNSLGNADVAARIIVFDVEADSFEYITPTYDFGLILNDAFSQPFILQDGKIAMMHYGYGVSIYDTVLNTWTLFSNTNVPGLTTSTGYGYDTQIAFDTVNDLIMFGDARRVGDEVGAPAGNAWGLVMFSINGYIKQTYYSQGAYAVGAWSFSTPAAMMQGVSDYDACAVVEPGSTSSMYVYWQHLDPSGRYAIKWDKDGSTMDVSGYLVGEVTSNHSIGGQRAVISFTVSHGHLFDPYNVSSALNSVMKKGRKMSLRWGENIGGTEYWQAAGEFFVTETSLSFERGRYPVMQVRAEDQRCLWAHGHIYATAIYNNTPKEIIDAILMSHAGLSVGDINTPAIGISLLEQQWMETTIDEILNQILEHYGYYFRFDYSGKAHARLITNTGSIDHTYADNTKLLAYTPDDRYSDFTNRVTVRGQSKTFTEVTYPEERITEVSGTLGWWGCQGEHVVWYSDDMTRRVTDPRMVVLESSSSIAMDLAGSIQEELFDVGSAGDYKYCMIYTRAPNLVGALIAQIAGLVAASFIPDPVVTLGVGATAGTTIPVGSAVRNFIVICIMNIIGSIANYRLEVWGKPLGEIRQSMQWQANDEVHQLEINAIVDQVIDDPLCYTQYDCKAVAEMELMVAQMQRRRVMIRKVAHLQDEDGDTIRLIHPYSGQHIDLFIASLTRSFKKADDGGDGYFIDEIEGWMLT